MSGYTKLFHSILASTVWEADMPTRIVWITMLAMADKNGVVDGSIPGLATLSRVSIEQCEHALSVLSSPDSYSRSKESDGRRIAIVDGGWVLVNHAKYRQMMNSDERREYLRVKQQEHRDRVKQAASKPRKSQRTRKNAPNTDVNSVSTVVAIRTAASTRSTHAEAEADPDTEAKGSTSVDVQVPTGEVRPPVPPLIPADLMALWNEGKSAAQRGCTVLSGERAAAARERLREVRAKVGQATEREFWRSMVEAIRANPYCNGQNDRGWVADFDYLVRGKTWVRFVEKTGWFDAARRDASLAVQNAPRTANETRAAIRAAAIDQTAGRDFFTPDEEQEPKAS